MRIFIYDVLYTVQRRTSYNISFKTRNKAKNNIFFEQTRLG